jgi:hypothetical protein
LSVKGSFAAVAANAVGTTRTDLASRTSVLLTRTCDFVRSPSETARLSYEANEPDRSNGAVAQPAAIKLNVAAGAVNLKFLPVSPRVHRRNFKFINRTRIIKLLVLLMFPKFA